MRDLLKDYTVGTVRLKVWLNKRNKISGGCHDSVNDVAETGIWMRLTRQNKD